MHATLPGAACTAPTVSLDGWLWDGEVEEEQTQQWCKRNGLEASHKFGMDVQNNLVVWSQCRITGRLPLLICP